MKRRFLFLAALCLAIVQAWGQTTLASGTCGAEGDGTHITWTLTSDSTLTLSGEGAVADFTHNTQPWQTYLTTIRTAVVGEGVTGIGDWFLCWCNNLTSVTLPEGLESVGDNFLGWCTGLTSLTLPGGLTSVGDNFLIHCMGLTSLTLPDGLTSVGNYFLYECKGLTSVTLPEGLESAGSLFLYGCTGLQELTAPVATPPVLGGNGAFEGVSNTIPVYVPAGSEAAYKTAAGWSYFTDYRPILAVIASGTCGAEGDGSNITWVLTADSTLTLSGTGAVADFELSAQPWQAHLSAIRTAVVGEGVTRIGNFFLYYCTGLDSITLPAGLTGVGEHFLESCESLTSVTLPEGLTSAGDYFLGWCTGLTSLTLPEELTGVGDNFLIHCMGLTSLTLPDGLTGVDDYFLYECKGLTSVTLPEGLTVAGNGFLYGCTGLTALTLPDGLESAGDGFLEYCTGLKELTVLAATPPALGSEDAFNGVSNTIPVYVPAGSTETYATAAGWSYFTDYRPIPTVVASGTCGAEGDGSNITWVLTDDGTLTLSGTGAVADFAESAQPWQAHLSAIRTAVIGDGITRIGDWFLSFCESLTSVTLPDGLTSVGDGFLGECRGLTSVTLPEGLTSVGSDFLAYCTGLTSLTLPGGLTGVGDYFLYECTGLTSLTLPDGLESVGHAFLIGCRGLTSLTLPEGLESAGDYFLSLCTGLKELTVLAATPPAVGSNGAFEGVDHAIPVYVPAGSIPAYAGAAVWDYFDTYLPIGTVAHGTCGAEGDGSNIIWYLTADGTLTLSGTGAVADFKLGAQPWQAHRASIRTAVVGEGVTGIGNNFLYGCPSLDSITLPETLESVGEGFLAYCTSLSSLTLPGGLTGIGDGFLSDCESLASVTLPGDVTSVGHGFLYGCTALASVTLPEGLESAGDTFLGGCSSLTSVTLPEGLESVGGGFLVGCRGLTSLTLPAGLTVAGDGFLYGCTGLEELTVLAAEPPAVGSNDAFEDVDNAIPVYVPAGSIEAYKTAAVWSYFTDYRPLGNTGIGTPSLAGSVTVAGGEVRLHLAGNPEVHVYDMQGRHVLSTTEHRIALPQGSYIIKVGREAVKVAL